jgi:hypothetical protein
MTRRDKMLIAWALAPNAIYVIGLCSLMVWRSVSGQSPLPQGAMLFVTPLSIVVPFGCAMLANAIRLRSNAHGACGR